MNKRKSRANNRKLSRWLQDGKFNYRPDIRIKTGLQKAWEFYKEHMFFSSIFKKPMTVYIEKTLQIL